MTHEYQMTGITCESSVAKVKALFEGEVAKFSENP